MTLGLRSRIGMNNEILTTKISLFNEKILRYASLHNLENSLILNEKNLGATLSSWEVTQGERALSKSKLNSMN